MGEHTPDTPGVETVHVEVVYGPDRIEQELSYNRQSVDGTRLSDERIMDMAESEIQTIAGPQADIHEVSIVETTG